jgi:presequence protease
MANHFELLGKQPISALNLEVERYRHLGTGALHLHLNAADSNNAFAVAFLTVPTDSTGVAHILEHTVLCGSERFPVRDPFFMMIKRSLNTFMNAFTASDWTAYPFASQNRKDFDNLLQVYLDAVFFPTLDPLDFAQEGHRLEPTERGNLDSDLELKGVVYNEMKGAMSPAASQVQQALQSALFPTITYHHNSGGDPEVIPELSYEALQSFHARHYHPSNATFLTYGDFPVSEHHERIHELALSRFDAMDINLKVPSEERYAAPRTVTTQFAVDGGDAKDDEAHVLVGWLLGDGTDARTRLRAHLLNGVLMDHSGSPLRAALETTSLGAAPSELCGLDDSTRECTFSVGLEGTRVEDAQAIEELILGVLRDVADAGVPAADVDSTLHQIELGQREVGGDHFPYGLGLMIKAMEPTLHGGDALEHLDIEAALVELREQSRDPNFLPDLIRSLLLDNPHRIRLAASPSAQLSVDRETSLAERLAVVRDNMSEAARKHLGEQAVELEARQEAQPDATCLPKVGIEDVPTELIIPTGQPGTLNAIPSTWYDAGTNGLVYARIVTPLDALSAEQLAYLPLFCDVLTEVGAADRDYRANQGHQAAVVGGIDASFSVRGGLHNADHATGYFVLASKALARNQGHLAQLLVDTLANPRFDEPGRIRELMAQFRVMEESRVTDSGHSLALSAANHGLSLPGTLNEQWSGLTATAQLKSLDQALDDEGRLAQLISVFQGIAQTLLGSHRQLVAVAQSGAHAAFGEALDNALLALPSASTTKAGLLVVDSVSPTDVAWLVNSQVNFCARAFKAAPQGHADSAALMVLGGLMRNEFLHRELREKGGAYGGGANYDGGSGTFGFFSYRDPRLSGTLDDFDRAVDWVSDGAGDVELREQAILGVISAIDRPGSPAGEALGAFASELHGRTAQVRRDMRARVLDVDASGLRSVAEKYLATGTGTTAVVTSERNLKADSCGDRFETREL